MGRDEKPGNCGRRKSQGYLGLTVRRALASANNTGPFVGLVVV